MSKKEAMGILNTLKNALSKAKGFTGQPIYRSDTGQFDTGASEKFQQLWNPNKAFASGGGSNLFGAGQVAGAIDGGPLMSQQNQSLATPEQLAQLRAANDNGGGDNGGGDNGGGGNGGGGDTGGDIGGIQNTDFYLDEFGNKQRITGDSNSRYYNAENAGKKALEAALGVFESRKKGLLNRIPGLESARDLRLRGLDEGLQQFVDTLTREEGSRVGEIQQTAKGVADQFKVSERQTRASAQGLARQLRDLFASAGTTDSTQFRDKNVENSSQILQTLGDLRRSGADKAATFGKEEEDIKSFFTEKVTQQRQQIGLAKDTAIKKTQDQIQAVMDAVDLNDAQKIDAVESANVRLQERLGQIDLQERTFTQNATKDAQDLAIKLQELKSKGTSSAFKTAAADKKSFSDAVTVIGKLKDQLGSMTPETAANVFSQFGFKDDEAQRLGRTYATSTTGNQDENPFSGLSA